MCCGVVAESHDRQVAQQRVEHENVLTHVSDEDFFHRLREAKFKRYGDHPHTIIFYLFLRFDVAHHYLICHESKYMATARIVVILRLV